MRQIKFRGRRLQGDWYYGSLDLTEREPKICFQDTVKDVDSGEVCPFTRRVAVDPSTIGQFTGLTDKNGTDVYEGDIIRIDCHPWLDWKELESVNAEVLFEGFAFIAQWKNPDVGKPYGFPDDEDGESEYVTDILSNLPNTIEVIGNIYGDKIKEE